MIRIDRRTEEGRMYTETVLFAGSLIASEQMKKNGDSIAEAELGMRSPFFVWETAIKAELGN